MPPRPFTRFMPLPARVAGGAVCFALAMVGPAAGQTSTESDTDRIDITGRQNLTLGSGARAYGMGGAFLARADDATAASWNPAGLSYLRVPEVSLVGVSNSFHTERGVVYDRFDGRAIDFAAFTWPLSLGEVGGAVQVSYQRAISFDGRRSIQSTGVDSAGDVTKYTDEAVSDGGFDVVAFGTGLRLSRHVRAGFTVNRWLNGYAQTLTRTFQTFKPRPVREYELDFRPRGWSFNVGAIVSPVDPLNLGFVYKTGFTADVRLDKARRDYWVEDEALQEVTRNAFASDAVRLEFPSSFGFGLSWRPRDTLTLSADFTRTSWSEARILNYFDVAATGPSVDGTPSVPPPPNVYPEQQYPTRLLGQQDAEQIRVGVEWVLIKGRLKIPLRGGYFNDRQITPNPTGDIPRFNGFTVGTGLILGSMLLDVAYVHEFGDYVVTADAAAGGEFDTPTAAPQSGVRNALKTNRFFASIIYRFSGSWGP